MAAWSVLRAGDDRLEIVGDVRTDDARSLWSALDVRAAKYGKNLELDLAKLTSIDGVAMALLVEFRDAMSARGTQCTIVNPPESARSLLHLYRGDEPPALAPARPPKLGPLTRLGAGVDGLVRRAYDPVNFIGELFEGIVQSIRKPRRVNWRSLPQLLVQAGCGRDRDRDRPRLPDRLRDRAADGAASSSRTAPTSTSQTSSASR